MCGILAVSNYEADAVYDIYVGLGGLQHRGKESAAMVVGSPKGYVWAGGMGEVPQAFQNVDLRTLGGCIGLGHVRYGTAGSSSHENIQPIRGLFHGREFYVVHNGNLVNTRDLRKQVSVSDDCSDTRVIAELVACSSRRDFDRAVSEVITKLQGAFNLVFLFEGELHAFRDPFGFHPLQVGRRQHDIIIASESCVCDDLGASILRDMRPGESLLIRGNRTISVHWTIGSLKYDLFEKIYFERPDSVIHGVEAGTARECMGLYLAKEAPVDADVVVPVPDSGNQAALGYWSGLVEQRFRPRFDPWALFRRHGISRTFIEPMQERRQQYLRLKFNPRPASLKGKRVVLVDDSIVRGNTAKRVVQAVRDAGAREVHMRVASPMYLYPDFYGIDTYRITGELVARRLNENLAKICQEIGSDSLVYLGLDSTIASVLKAGGLNSEFRDDQSFYTGPFTGEYPAGAGDFASLL
ncbi:MAG: amidophosphoribosyltransferase [Candidatus Doudnabacteria bacterium]|nr:amidophosphoribosyltransferase [Candidatus Doudnabacteria bacterium]